MLNGSCAPTISSISFSDVQNPFEMISNRHFDWVGNYGGTGRPRILPSSFEIVTAASLISEKAITSPYIADLRVRRLLYDLNSMGVV